MNPVACTALIDFAAVDSAGQATRCLFGAPLKVLRADDLSQVRAVLAEVDELARSGLWCVGFVAYEAAPAFDEAFDVHPSQGPLVWFGVYEHPLTEPAIETLTQAGRLQVAKSEWEAGADMARFGDDIRAIRSAIAAGEFYQVNHTSRVTGRLTAGTPWDLYLALRQAQPGAFSAYLDAGHMQVMSVSPELFFDWCGGRLLVRPMKGTAPRSEQPDDDAALAQALRASPKERAENVMIVDLIRNDLSRVALPHTVKVPRLFHTEPLPSVWQMTSDVTAMTRPEVRLVDVFEALFPCGSVTGAPKVRSMSMIRQLEPHPRGVYCGAIGIVRPGGEATFNVAIRTVVARQDELLFGVGSGITSDSTVEGEWREWRHKRAFLERASEGFDLLETLALEDGHFRYLEDHLARMQLAARHFRFPWDESSVQDALQALASAHPLGLWRVRLLLDASGHPHAQAYTMPSGPTEVTLALADRPFTWAGSEFVRYKTTKRAHYDAFAPQQADIFDTLLWNEQGELTECTRGNIALQIGGEWLTPPLQSGLLPGVGRAKALAQGTLREAAVHVEDLPRVEGMAFINSLRGWITARLR